MKNKLSTIVSALLLSGSLYAKDINIVKGWQMKGSDSGFSNMDAFNKSCIDTIWNYDTTNKRWKAYSPNISKQNIINNNTSVMSLSSLNGSDGFWVNGNSDCVIDGNSTNSATLNDGLVAYYEFEGNAKDSSGNGNDGTEYAVNSKYDTGVINQSKEFINGNSYTSPSNENDYITTPMTLNKTSFSISVFIKPNEVINNGGAESIISYGRDTVSGKEFYSIFLNPDLEVYVSIFNKSYEHKATKGKKIGNDKFYHIVSIYTPEKIKLYIDGVLIETIKSLSLDFDQYKELMIASHKWSYEQHSTRFSGKIDDFRIYNRALSESEIQELYNLGK